MPTPLFYRYFLGFRPSPLLRAWFSSLAAASDQSANRVSDEYLHLTLCVIAETFICDRSIVARAASALDGRSLWSSPFWLHIVKGTAEGASVRPRKRQDELQDFYSMLLRFLAEREIFPLHRESGLHPHVTLGYDPCARVPLILPQEWIPDELLLIESKVGWGKHQVLARWPLLPPRQGGFMFGEASRFAA